MAHSPTCQVLILAQTYINAIRMKLIPLYCKYTLNNTILRARSNCTYSQVPLQDDDYKGELHVLSHSLTEIAWQSLGAVRGEQRVSHCIKLKQAVQHANGKKHNYEGLKKG